MIIARERFLDATKDLHLTLSLSTRTGRMHSLLSNVPDAAREAISDILVEALDRVEQQLDAHVVRPATEP